MEKLNSCIPAQHLIDNPRQTPYLLKKEEENETDRRKRSGEKRTSRCRKIYIRKERVCEAPPPPSPSLKESKLYKGRNRVRIYWIKLIFDGVVILSDGTTPVDWPELEESSLLRDAANGRGGAASVDCLLGGGKRRSVDHGTERGSDRREGGRCWEGRRVDRGESKEAGGLADGMGLGSSG